mgnify:CR=1 FL=1
MRKLGAVWNCKDDGSTAWSEAHLGELLLEAFASGTWYVYWAEHRRHARVLGSGLADDLAAAKRAAIACVRTLLDYKVRGKLPA